jgi:hypothetical protein
MKKNSDLFDEIFRFVGMFIAGTVVLLLVSGIIFGLLGYIDDKPNNPHRILATLLILLLFVAYWLGHREGKAHRAGMERGIDLKVNALQRPRQVLSMRPADPTPSPAEHYNALLPVVGTRATIVTRTDTDTSAIEM